MTLGWRGGVYHIWAAPQQPGWCRQCHPSWPPCNLSADTSYPAAPSLLPSPRSPGQTPCGGSQQPETPASMWEWKKITISVHVWNHPCSRANLPQSEAPQEAPSVLLSSPTAPKSRLILVKSHWLTTGKLEIFLPPKRRSREQHWLQRTNKAGGWLSDAGGHLSREDTYCQRETQN